MSSVVCATFHTSMWGDPARVSECRSIRIEVIWQKQVPWLAMAPGYLVFSTVEGLEPLRVFSSRQHDRSLRRALSLYKKHRAIDAKHLAAWVARNRAAPKPETP